MVAHSEGTDAPLFQPHTNYRTLDFDKALSTGMAQEIVKRWAGYSRLGDRSPHDSRGTAITRALEAGLTYRQVQMMSKYKDPKTVMRYDHGGESRISSRIPSARRPLDARRRVESEARVFHTRASRHRKVHPSCFR